MTGRMAAGTSGVHQGDRYVTLFARDVWKPAFKEVPNGAVLVMHMLFDCHPAVVPERPHGNVAV